MDAKHDANGLQSGQGLHMSARVELPEATNCPPMPTVKPPKLEHGETKIDLLITLMATLIESQRSTTDAINSLAQSNMALVDVILDQIDDGYGDSAGLSRNYLDGSSL